MEEHSPTALPTLSEMLAECLGFQIPGFPILQTLKNLDKAFARVVGAGGENLASRIDANTNEIKAIAAAKAAMIEASSHGASHEVAARGLVGRAFAHDLEQKLLRQSNREKIWLLAVKHLSLIFQSDGIDSNFEIDDDWLNRFTDLSGQKSNLEIQGLWAKILAGEIRKPKSFSLKSLDLLSGLDAKDAGLIHEILGLSISYEVSSGSGCFVFKIPRYKSHDKYLQSEALGVLIGTSGGLCEEFRCSETLKFATSKSYISVIFDVNSVDRIVQFPAFPLTRFGSELRELSSVLTCDFEYERRFMEVFQIQGAKVLREEIGTPR